MFWHPTINAKLPIQPFWQRLPEIASYPFSGGAAATIAALVLVILLLGWLPVLGFVITLVCWLAGYKYAFEILQRSAHGELSPPEAVLRIDNSLVLYFIGLQLVLWMVPTLVLLLAPPLGPAMFGLVLLIQPVAIMVLAMSGSLGNALDPSRWFAVIRAIGWPYLAVVGLLFVIQGSALKASALVAKVLPLMLADPIVNAFVLWGLFATFHLMGYLIYQFHKALDFDPETHQQVTIIQPRDRDQQLLDQASERLQAGQPEAATALLREAMQERAVSTGVHELYRRLLTQSGDRNALVEHGRLFLHLLLIEKQERRALGLARECLDIDPDFTTPEVEDGARLAKRAAAIGQSALAIDLLRAAIRQHPRHPEGPNWSLAAAELLLREPGRETEARSLLESARERANEQTLPRIEALLTTLRAG